MARRTRIPEELAAFLASGVSIVVATRDGALAPDGAAACAAVVHDDREHLTAFLYRDAAEEMLVNLRVHPAIALDFDLPTSHRACQVKGVMTAARPAREEEQEEVMRQLDAFAADLEQIGIPRAATSGWSAWPCTAIEVRVTDLFEQTPGPGTGERMP